MSASSIIVQVHWKPHARVHEKASWNLVEVPFGDFDGFTAELSRGGLIDGTLLYTRKVEETDFAVISEMDVLFTRDAVDRVQPATGTFTRGAR